MAGVQLMYGGDSHYTNMLSSNSKCDYIAATCGPRYFSTVAHAVAASRAVHVQIFYTSCICETSYMSHTLRLNCWLVDAPDVQC